VVLATRRRLDVRRVYPRSIMNAVCMRCATLVVIVDARLAA
jgi:hypothetical protein